MLLIATSFAPASANSAWFTRVWQTDDGLLNNNIHAIVQSRDDYLWVVTPVSLMRFDGASFSQFPIKDFTGLIEPHNIRTLLYGRKGVLWIVPNIGTVVGLNPDFSVAALPKADLPASAPSALAEDGDGWLWLGYSSGIYRIKDGQVVRFGAEAGVPPDGLHSLTSDGAGNIWLAKGNQICVFRNGQFQQVAGVPRVQCMAATHTNAVWFVAGTHLFICDAEGTLRDQGAFQNSPAVAADALLEDRDGAVWIGTDGNGLFRYSKSGFEKVETSHSAILSLAEDREGNIWVGTGGGGLNRLCLSSVRQEVLESDQTVEQIQSICEDTHGRLWGATHNGALVSRINGRWNIFSTNAPFAGTVTCVASDLGGAVWIGTRNGELLRLANTNYTMWNQNSGLAEPSIFALQPTPTGDLWIVGDNHVQRLHDGQLQEAYLPQPIQSLPRQVWRISAVAEDSAGNLWIGAKGVVMRFDGGKFVDETPRLPVSNRTICCLAAASDGSMWISCGGAGLLRFKDGRVGQIGAEQGLFNNYISQIVADGHGWFWFGSDRGIFKIRQQELEQAMEDHSVRLRPIVYGRNEGLSSMEAIFSTASPFVHPRAILTRDGQVCLLMHTGIVVADPGLLPENCSAPPVLLTGVVMDGRVIASYGSVASTQTVANLKTIGIPLRLPPGHRHLEFDFTAMHFTAPENVHFRYQLAGFDNDWIDAEAKRSVEYSHLAAGDYQLRVEACVGDGPWSEVPATLALTVAPFFWQTWWFLAGVLALFTLTVIAIVRYISFRHLQVKIAMLEQRAALDRERTRIARDLHDDLGCSLNKVALTLDMTKRELETAESLNGKIQHCSTMVRQVARSVDEIVWAINPRNDTLLYIVDYISQFAVEFLHAADIPCRVDLPDNIPNRVVSPEARHNLLLVVKEALNNIARHARANEVRLCITATDDQVAITIEDNGRGFECAPDNASSDGLRNMRQRMEEVGGQFQLASRSGAGTRVAFLYSWPSNKGKQGEPKHAVSICPPPL